MQNCGFSAAEASIFFRITAQIISNCFIFMADDDYYIAVERFGSIVFNDNVSDASILIRAVMRVRLFLFQLLNLNSNLN